MDEAMIEARRLKSEKKADGGSSMVMILLVVLVAIYVAYTQKMI